VILPPGKEYTFSYQSPEGEEFYREDIFVNQELSYQEINREVNLEPIKLLGKIKAKSKELSLKGIVLDNPSTQKPLAKAIVYITLNPGESYTIYAEYNGKKTESYVVSTKNVTPPQLFNQVIFLEGKPSGQVVPVEITVLDNTKKPLSGANVIFSDKTGNKYELVTDENGKVSGNVPLSKVYEVYATDANGNSSNVYKVNSKSKITKTLVIKTKLAPSERYEKGEADYAFFFGYNKSRIDVEAEDWKQFIQKVANLSKNGKVNIHISSSAPRVPTIHYNGNKGLAKARGERTADKIREFVSNAGGNASNLTFTYQWKVGGPKYIGDFTMRRKYEPHQFVKAFIKK